MCMSIGLSIGAWATPGYHTPEESLLSLPQQTLTADIFSLTMLVSSLTMGLLTGVIW